MKSPRISVVPRPVSSFRSSSYWTSPVHTIRLITPCTSTALPFWLLKSTDDLWISLTLSSLYLWASLPLLSVCILRVSVQPSAVLTHIPEDLFSSGDFALPVALYPYIHICSLDLSREYQLPACSHVLGTPTLVSIHSSNEQTRASSLPMFCWTWWRKASPRCEVLHDSDPPPISLSFLYVLIGPLLLILGLKSGHPSSGSLIFRETVSYYLCTHFFP